MSDSERAGTDRGPSRSNLKPRDAEGGSKKETVTKRVGFRETSSEEVQSNDDPTPVLQVQKTERLNALLREQLQMTEQREEQVQRQLAAAIQAQTVAEEKWKEKNLRLTSQTTHVHAGEIADLVEKYDTREQSRAEEYEKAKRDLEGMRASFRTAKTQFQMKSQ
jgi:hypothetical protein